jgi:N-methylhydantoinase B
MPVANSRAPNPQGSGRRGLHAGGDSIVREFEFLTGGEVTILSDRRARGPYGLSGGEAGKPGRNSVMRGGRGRKVGAKERFAVEAGDVLRIESPGGGGWGQAVGRGVTSG